MRKSIYILFFIILLTGCKSESCKIDFENNTDLFYNALKEIETLKLDMNSNEPYYRIVKSFTKSTSPISRGIFNQIEFVECHKDGTIIFQASNCDKEYDLRDVIYFIAYSKLGKPHIERKRNIGELKELERNWFLGTHILSLAN